MIAETAEVLLQTVPHDELPGPGPSGDARIAVPRITPENEIRIDEDDLLLNIEWEPRLIAEFHKFPGSAAELTDGILGNLPAAPPPHTLFIRVIAAVIFDLVRNQNIIRHDQRIELDLSTADPQPYIPEDEKVVMPDRIKHRIIFTLARISRPVPPEIRRLLPIKVRTSRQSFKVCMLLRPVPLSNEHICLQNS